MLEVFLGCCFATLYMAIPFAFAFFVSTARAEPLNYGDEVNGVEMALEQPAGGILRIHLRNKGPGDAKLTRAFVWLLLAESKDKAFYSEKIPLDDEKPELAPAQEMVRELDLSQAELYPYQKGVKVVQGYPQPAAPAEPVKVTDLPTALRAQAFAYLSAGGERGSIKSRATPVLARTGKAPGVATATTMPAAMASLIEAFRRDAFSAKSAQDRAVKVGAAALPALKDAIADPTMPDFGQMWIATAIVHINGTDAATIGVGLVDSPNEGIRDVVAYHGPSMKQQSVDQAIMARAGRGDDPLFTAWAARGFADNGRPFPQELIDATYASREPRARAEVADVLAKRAQSKDVQKLATLARDDNELVRVAVADAVHKYNLADATLRSAMVTSLAMPGESSRQRMVQALAGMAHENWEYDPQMAEQQRLAVLAQVRAWAMRGGKQTQQ